MNKSHVPNKSTCQKLADLIELDTEFYWVSNVEDRWYVDNNSRMWSPYSFGNYYDEYIPAPLLSELLEVMPDTVTVNDEVALLTYLKKWHVESREKAWYHQWYYWAESGGIKGSRKSDENPSEAAAQLLIWLIENNHKDLSHKQSAAG